MEKSELKILYAFENSSYHEFTSTAYVFENEIQIGKASFTIIKKTYAEYNLLLTGLCVEDSETKEAIKNLLGYRKNGAIAYIDEINIFNNSSIEQNTLFNYTVSQIENYVFKVSDGSILFVKSDCCNDDYKEVSSGSNLYYKLVDVDDESEFYTTEFTTTLKNYDYHIEFGEEITDATHYDIKANLKNSNDLSLGFSSILVFDNNLDSDFWDIADAISGDLESVISLFYSFLREVEVPAFYAHNKLAVIDHVGINKIYRNQQLGTKFIKSQLNYLFRFSEVDIVILQAVPFELERNDPNYKNACERLEAFYESLGFERLQDNLFGYMKFMYSNFDGFELEVEY